MTQENVGKVFISERIVGNSETQDSMPLRSKENLKHLERKSKSKKIWISAGKHF